MVPQKPCQGCSQRDGCEKIYDQLGKIKGPSLVSTTLLAFLLPLLVFIASLAAFDRILNNLTTTKGLRAILAFLPALGVTAALMLTIRLLRQRFDNDR